MIDILSRERAAEVIHAQNQWPFWGNFSRFMTDAEIAYVRTRWDANPNGNSSFASTVYRIASEQQESV